MNFITDNEQLLVRVFEGAIKVSKMVEKTLGPKGKNIAIVKGRETIFTNDGVTVAKNISLPDPFEDIGARAVIEGCISADKVGDGTTTTAILISSILKKMIDVNIITDSTNSNKVNVNQITKGMRDCVDVIVEILSNRKKEITSIKQAIDIATTSCKDKELGTLIGKCAFNVGKGSFINVEKGYSRTSTVDIVDGVKIQTGYVSNYLCTDPGVVKLRKPMVLLYNGDIDDNETVLSIIFTVLHHRRDILVVCNDISQESIGLIVTNRQALNGNRIGVIKNPYTDTDLSELYEDLSLILNTNVIEESNGQLELPTIQVPSEDDVPVSVISEDYLGSCSEVKIEKDATSIIGTSINYNVKSKIEELKTSMKDKNDNEKESIKQRISFLLGKCATIKVGGITNSEIETKMFKVTDAVSSVMEAIDNGFLPGEGISLFDIYSKLRITVFNSLPENKGKDEIENNDYLLGAKIVFYSLNTPFESILKNCNLDYKNIIYKMSNNSELDCQYIGYDVNNINYDDNKAYINLLEAGILDSFNTVVSSLSNAVSIASNLLSTSGIIVPLENVIDKDCDLELKVYE